MGMTMTEKILAQHAGRDAVQAGDLLVAQVDLVLANDITGPPAIAEFEKIGRPVFDKDKIALVPDHFSPCKDIKSATMCKRMRDFARQHEIHYKFHTAFHQFFLNPPLNLLSLTGPANHSPHRELSPKAGR